MITVVIADDEKWVTLGIRQLLGRQEIPVEVVGTAENGIEAMELLLELHPDVLITDIRMPGMDGLELMEKMQNCGIDSKVVFVTGYAEFSYVQKAIHMGAVDYLLKPLQESQVREVLLKLQDKLEQEKADDGLSKLRQAFQVQTGISEKREEKEYQYQCIEVQLTLKEETDRKKARQETMLEADCLSWFALKKKKDRVAFFLRYPGEWETEEALEILRQNTESFTAAGGSMKIRDKERLGALLEEADTALCSCLFAGKEGYAEYETGKKKTERTEKYLSKEADCLKEKNWNRLRVLLEDLEEDILKGGLLLDQLALIYNHLAASLNAADFSLEYFTAAALEEQFGTAQAFFSYIRRAIFERKTAEEEENVSNSLLYSIVMRVKAENLKDAAALGELADQFNVSSGYLSNLLKKELGMPYSEYLAGKRIEKAKELLQDPKMSVEEVAEAVGYKDYFYFLKVFKKYMGSSPSKYRKLCIEKMLPK